MTSSPTMERDPRFPGLNPEVVQGYLDAPENMVAEVLDGELFVLPRPRARHGFTATCLARDLGGPFQLAREGPGGWIFIIEQELHLGRRPDIVVPDVCGWHRDRLPPDFFDDDKRAAITIAPDWVCEVLSDRTEGIDRGKKRRIYRREGVKHYWLIDAREHLLEIHRLENGRWVEAEEHQGDVRVRAEPFDAIDLDLALLWAR